jgi:hypothetical protein
MLPFSLYFQIVAFYSSCIRSHYEFFSIHFFHGKGKPDELSYAEDNKVQDDCQHHGKQPFPEFLENPDRDAEQGKGHDQAEYRGYRLFCPGCTLVKGQAKDNGQCQNKAGMLE